MKYLLSLALFLLPGFYAFSQCKIALDLMDEFDSSRIVATSPVVLGYLVASGNVAGDLEGQKAVEEAKAIFSFGNENKIRSFFLTLGVVERKFFLIEPDYNVWLKFVNGPIVRLLNVPDEGEFDRKILMWKYVHTCVIPLEIFHMMKNDRVEKIRIDYKDYEKTIVLEEKQQIALQAAVKCVEERLLSQSQAIKP
jgi:hypothetical protein